MTDRELADRLRKEVQGEVVGSDDEGYAVEYVGADGEIKTMRLEAEDASNALFEAVGLLCD